MACARSLLVYVLLLESSALLTIALPITSQSHSSSRYLQVGQPCQTYIICNDTVMLSEEIKTCDDNTCTGPNVCQVTTEYENYYEHGIYSCLGKRCRRLQCVPTGVCNVTVNESFTEYQCCHGYVEALIAGRSDYHQFYYPIPKDDTIQINGCPRELNETICDCLETLKLSDSLALVKRSSLDDVICNNNNTTSIQYTVFAPTNEAIRRVGLSTLSTNELLRVLKAHIIPVQINSKHLFGVYGQESLATGHYVHVDNSGPWASPYNVVNGQRLLIEDACKSFTGIVHVVDGVINSTNKSIAQLLKDTPQFSTIWSLLVTANLTNEINNPNLLMMTFFAPDNTAFERGNSELGINIAQCLANNTDTLHFILKYHMMYEFLYHTILSQRSFLPTEACYWESLEFVSHERLQSDILNFDPCILDIRNTDEGTSVGVTGSVITEQDIGASNGVIHMVSLPLIPPHINLIHLCTST